MLNPGFVTSKALATWQDIPVFLPQFQFHEKHQTVIKTNSPEKILPLIAEFDIQQDAVIRRLMSLRHFRKYSGAINNLWRLRTLAYTALLFWKSHYRSSATGYVDNSGVPISVWKMCWILKLI